jgi:serine/threonine protein kinase
MPADLWSCGVIMFAMSYGYLPFEGDVQLDRRSDPVTWTPANVYHLYQHIAISPIKLPRGLSEMGEDLVRRLLIADPELRITEEEVWSHRWWEGCDNKISS